MLWEAGELQSSLRTPGCFNLTRACVCERCRALRAAERETVCVVTELKHLQREVQEPRQRGVGVGLPGGGADVVSRGQQQQEGDAVADLHHLLTVETEVAGLCVCEHTET